jgi:outer membrane protein OmpA-like peptidoglycan-associated protein
MRFYFTVCKENWQNKNICEIHVIVKLDNEWQTPLKLSKPVNLSNYTSTHVSVTTNSKNADVLYFASDRPGGRGGLDIWYAEYDIKSNWFTEPKNLGAKINTVRDEITPFIEIKSHGMFYSSNGISGLGGYDIYKTYGEKRKWSKPENLGLPLNSGADDFFYTVRENNGFLVSNRADSASGKTETCCDDIFAFSINPSRNFILKGSIYNINPNSYIKGLADKNPKNIKVFLYMKNEKDYFLADECTTDESGKYSFKAEKDKDYKIMVNTLAGEEFIEVASAEMQKLSDDTMNLVAIGIDYIPTQPITINDVLYAYDDYTLTEEAKSTIIKNLLPVLDENPALVIEICSHTDNKGEGQYNIDLSQKRAQSVVDFLIENGISSDRLVAKGYGEELPLTANYFPDGTDNETGRKLNRRTEFKILSLDNTLVAEIKKTDK